MHNCTMQAHKVRKYISTSLKHAPKYRYIKANKGCHTLEMRMNGTRHDIPNTTHLREKGRRKEGVKKST